MEFYLSFSDILSKFPNPMLLVFFPIFIFTILAEALVIQARHGSYSWKNTGSRPWSRSGISLPRRPYMA
jgi:ABC-type dipeptide/oligopeptide/nickel transport system permease component